MNTTIARVPLEERQILRNLMELYQFETSAYENKDVGPLGLYPYRYFDHYWTEEGRHPFMVRCDDRLAGFTLVNGHCLVSKDGPSCAIAEFFIMPRYRREGVGRHVAESLFRMFPGQWEVRQVDGNEAAQLFWRKVIGDFTGGRYVETYLDDDRWHGPVQNFDSSSSDIGL